MKAAAKAIVHRVKQARSAILKIEVAWAGLQLLIALGSIGALVGLVVWARRRRTRGEPARVDTAAAPAVDGERSAPVGVTSAKAAANGLVN
ncbi:hypothetical protein [Mycobacterium montefiorense]|uniref:hypothetical protein n=1 Tax=Mycobacterium montefiorense TaxID=154654 RepID=UPI0021DDB70B|nr:hypothetical protein [Mycobacterium montefiorense]MCV7426284.1 hypothetical protein [Mycobacterium montefiorense]GLE50958.1 hypothetical protein ATCCBAA256_05430 [Mycobacterium montefiorense]